MTDFERLMAIVWSGALDDYTPKQIDAAFATWLRHRGIRTTDGVSPWPNTVDDQRVPMCNSTSAAGLHCQFRSGHAGEHRQSDGVYRWSWTK